MDYTPGITTRAARPVTMSEAEAKRLNDNLTSMDMLRRVADHGFWSSDQFGTDWASHEAQGRAAKVIQEAEAVSANRAGGYALSYAYDRGKYLPATDCD